MACHERAHASASARMASRMEGGGRVELPRPLSESVPFRAGWACLCPNLPGFARSRSGHGWSRTSTLIASGSRSTASLRARTSPDVVRNTTMATRDGGLPSVAGHLPSFAHLWSWSFGGHPSLGLRFAPASEGWWAREESNPLVSKDNRVTACFRSHSAARPDKEFGLPAVARRCPPPRILRIGASEGILRYGSASLGRAKDGGVTGICTPIAAVRGRHPAVGR